MTTKLTHNIQIIERLVIGQIGPIAAVLVLLFSALACKDDPKEPVEVFYPATPAEYIQLAIDNQNPEVLVFNGVQVTVHVAVFDHEFNPAADGTVVVFRTEYGSIDPTCTTVFGQCDVTWTSSAPRSYPFTMPSVDVKRLGLHACDDLAVQNGEPCPYTNRQSQVLAGNGFEGEV